MKKNLRILAFLLSLADIAMARGGGIIDDPSAISYFKDVGSSVEWRLYRPDINEEYVFQRLPKRPDQIIWQRGSRAAFYLSGRILYKVEWRLGSKAEQQVRLPELQTVDQLGDIWIDKNTGKWRISTIEPLDPREVLTVKERGQERVYFVYKGQRIPATGRFYKEYPYVASVQEYNSDDNWRVIAARTTGCEMADDPCLSVMDDLVQKSGSVSDIELRESARIENYEASLQWLRGDMGDGIAFLPSDSQAGGGLEVRVHTGDSPHAIAPLFFVNKTKAERLPIYQREEGCGEQIAFAEKNGYLLVGSEYDLKCARAVDMRTGKTIKVFPKESTSLWINFPENK